MRSPARRWTAIIRCGRCTSSKGLADNRIAVVGKVHHALADGVAAANLLARGMDLAPGPQDGEGRYAPDPAPSTGELVRSAFADHMRHIGRIPGTIGYTAKGINRVRRSSRKLSPELTMPFTPPPTFMNHMLTPERRFATATLALSDIKETSKALGVTINDMVLALSAGALRKLRVRYDGVSDHPLLASVPVSFDFSPDRVSGNLFTGMMVALPADIDDPLERVKRSHDYAVEAKESHHCSARNSSADGRRTFRRGPRSRCSAGWPAATGRTRCSTCRSPTFRVRVNTAGSAVRMVTEIYSVGPLTTGSGLNITVWSYVDQLNVSVLADGATVDDPHEVTEAIIDELIEIRRAAGLSEELTVIEGALAQA